MTTDNSHLPLRELEASASALLAVLLAFLAASVTGNHAACLEGLAQLDIEDHERAGDAELDGIGLAVDAAARQSLGIADIGQTFDVVTTVRGGGIMGQADAVKLGIARALMVFNPELRKALKAEGLVTRDSRGKERKKYGQKGARARFQFSKR